MTKTYLKKIFKKVLRNNLPQALMARFLRTYLETGANEEDSARLLADILVNEDFTARLLANLLPNYVYDDSVHKYFEAFLAQVLRSYLEAGINEEDSARLLADLLPNEEYTARLLANLLPNYVYDDRVHKYFDLWEAHGFHLLPVGYYSPIPEVRSLPESVWHTQSAMRGINQNEAIQLELLRNIFPLFRDEYSQFPLEPTDNPSDYYFNNGMFSSTDPLVLYAMVRHFKPNTILEVGSGFSTRVSAKAALKNGNTRLISVEPNPSQVLIQGFPGLSELIARPIQDVDPAIFSQLGKDDILFIDTSHVSRIGSEVNYLFLDILPTINPGVIVHVHDIFLPLEYGKFWIVDAHMFSNEQYILQAFLSLNPSFEILYSSVYLKLNYPGEVKNTFPTAPEWSGSSFWMRRR